MKLQEIFAWQRFWHLIKNDLLKNYRSLLIALGAVSGVLLFINVMVGLGQGDPQIPFVYFALLLMIGGAILSSLAFREIHDAQKGHLYLTLPSSLLEKLVSKLLLTTVGYIVVTILFFYLLSLLARLLNLLVFDYASEIFNPFTTEVWQLSRIYVIIQSFFLFAGVYFRKIAFLKLFFILFMISIILSLFAGLAGRIIFRNYGQFFRGFQVPGDFMSSAALESFANTIANIATFIFYWIMAPYFWILSYFRLKEKEV